MTIEIKNKNKNFTTIIFQISNKIKCLLTHFMENMSKLQYRLGNSYVLQTHPIFWLTIFTDFQNLWLNKS